MATKTEIPLVDYLVLGDDPHLIANECTSCGARFFDRRNACASCFATDFRTVDIPTEGVLKSFTIVTFAAPGVPVPFVAGIVDCGGTSVRGCGDHRLGCDTQSSVLPSEFRRPLPSRPVRAFVRQS